MTATTLESMIGLDERLTPEQLSKLMPLVRQAMRDKSYQLTPMGEEVARYLRSKRKRLTEQSFQSYENVLSKFAQHFADLRLEDFELPVGAERVEEWLEAYWGSAEPATYIKSTAMASDFFDHWVKRGRMYSNPCVVIERPRKREKHREIFSQDQHRAIIASTDDRRDGLALRLLLEYGLRRESLRLIQFKHFDHQRKRLTVFLKRGKVRAVPIPDPHFWMDLERLILDVNAEQWHFLMRGKYGGPEKPMARTTIHEWWYRMLEAAGVVAKGQQSGERMHKARHTAGQRLLDSTHGDLKMVQKLLHHESIKTTADTYVDYDLDQLAEALSNRSDWDAEDRP